MHCMLQCTLYCLQWVMSLPVDPKTAHQQQLTAQQYSTAQWAADRRVWWEQPPQNTYLAPSNTAAQEKLLQHLENLKDKPSSDSDSDSDSEDDVKMTSGGDYVNPSGGGYVNPDDIIVMEELGGGNESSEEEDDSSEEEGAAAAAAGGKGGVVGYPCALPLSYLLALPQQVRARKGEGGG